MHHPARIALIDDTGQVPVQDLSRYATSFNHDISENFGPVWGARAIVTVATEETKPRGSWAIKIQEKLDQLGALGYHTDRNNQPLAFVMLTNDVSVTISHELKEMLADEWGNRLRTAGLPRGLDAGQVGCQPGDLVEYLLEVCDPPEAASYQVLGVRQSDFICPPWYRNFESSAAHYSFAGGCTTPLQVADGGYCSFSRQDGDWFQVFNQNGALQVSELGKYSRGEGAWSLREWVDSKAREFRLAKHD